MKTYEVNPIGTIYNGESGTFLQLAPKFIPALQALDGFKMCIRDRVKISTTASDILTSSSANNNFIIITSVTVYHSYLNKGLEI